MTDPSQPGYPPSGPQNAQDPTYPSGPAPGQQPAAPPQQPARSEPKFAFSVGQILGAILFILVIIFIIENSQTVKIRIIVPVVHAPLYVAILIAAVLGALIAALLRYRRRVGARRKALVREHKAENRQ